MEFHNVHSDLCCIPHIYIALSFLDTNSYTTILCLFRLLYIAFNIQDWRVVVVEGTIWIHIVPILYIGGYNMDTLSSQMVQSQSVTSIRASAPWFSTKLLFNPVSLFSDSTNSLFERSQQHFCKKNRVKMATKLQTELCKKLLQHN